MAEHDQEHDPERGLIFYRDRRGEWRWRAVRETPGGQRIVGDSGEGYGNLVDARNGFELVRAMTLEKAEIAPTDDERPD